VFSHIVGHERLVCDVAARAATGPPGGPTPGQRSRNSWSRCSTRKARYTCLRATPHRHKHIATISDLRCFGISCQRIEWPSMSRARDPRKHLTHLIVAPSRDGAVSLTPSSPPKNLASASIAEQNGWASTNGFADTITIMPYRSVTDDRSQDGR
jgi:hypothetical protein